MVNIEEKMTQMVCDYVTDRIKKNLRVNVLLSDKEVSKIKIVGLRKCLKNALNDIVKSFPDSIDLKMKGK
jgi:hypothetical protein